MESGINVEQHNKNKKNTHEMTQEMKYIQWPSIKKVSGEFIAVLAGSAVTLLLLAAADSLDKVILNTVTAFF